MEGDVSELNVGKTMAVYDNMRGGDVKCFMLVCRCDKESEWVWLVWSDFQNLREVGRRTTMEWILNKRETQYIAYAKMAMFKCCLYGGDMSRPQKYMNIVAVKTFLKCSATHWGI